MPDSIPMLEAGPMLPSPGTVDLAQPLLDQVGRMGEAYDAWVHRSIKPRESLRIFRRPWLEALSHVPWWIVPLVWVPAALILWVRGVTTEGVPPARAAALSLAGLAAWTLLEYGLHRWVFHYRPRTSLGRRVHFLAHGIHHLDPWDATRLVMPPLAAAGIALPVFAVVYAVALVLAPSVAMGSALAFFAGILVGYVAYDLTHYYAHHARPRGSWGKRLKAWHLAHHHRYPDRLYGVTLPVWDVLLGTGRPTA